MVALAATNFLGAVLFGAVYAAAGANLLSQRAFGLSVVLLFVLVTTAWLRVERRQGRDLEPIRRIGRVTIGLVTVLVGAPMLVLMPLFGLDREIAGEAGLTPVIAPVMVVLFVSLLLVVLVNVAGCLWVVVGGVLGGRRARRAAS